MGILVCAFSVVATSAQNRDAATGMEFVRIQPGEFMMGCSSGDNQCYENEKPAYRVRITKGFEMGKYEVTQAQWESVMGSNPSNFRGADRPVERVSWNDAQDFLQKLNSRQDGYRYRLPTEAEWEYAARAGTTGSYAGNLDAMAWYSINSGGQTHPVGQKQPNAWGLYDMHGNVWEWAQDWFGNYAAAAQTDPGGPVNGQSRVQRGGCWYSVVARNARVSVRGNDVPTIRNNFVGFRCVREAIP